MASHNKSGIVQQVQNRLADEGVSIRWEVIEKSVSRSVSRGGSSEVEESALVNHVVEAILEAHNRGLFNDDVYVDGVDTDASIIVESIPDLEDIK